MGNTWETPIATRSNFIMSSWWSLNEIWAGMDTLEMRINEFFFADSPVFTDRVIMSGQVVNVIMRSESSVNRREAVWLLGRSSTTVKPRVPVAYSKSPFLHGPKMGRILHTSKSWSSRFDQPKTQRTKKYKKARNMGISNHRYRWVIGLLYGSSWLLGSQGNDHINSYNICISLCVCV